MTGPFRVCLVHLDGNAATDASDSGGSDDVVPLLHAEVDGPGEERAAASVALLTRFYCCAASIVNELEEGQVLLQRRMSATHRRGSPAHLQLRDGGRLFILNPVEGGEFMLFVTIPAKVWRWMGPVAVQVLLATAVCGYEIATNVAAVVSVPTYCPLRERIRESADAVENAVQMRLEQLAKFVAFLDECEQQEKVSCSEPREGDKQAALSLVRMCQQRPSPMFTHHRLAYALQQLLLCAATHYSDYSALCGAMPSNGMQSGYKRLVVTSAAVWYHGEPIFSNATSDEFEAHLLPAAVVAYAHRCLSAGGADVVQPQVTVKSVAMSSHALPNVACSAGYVKLPQEQKEHSATVCVTFVSSGGWVIALRLERALNLFTGAPMPHIVSGVTRLITTTLETPRFVAAVREFFKGRLLETQHTASLAHTAGTMHILRAVRYFGLFAHFCGDAVASPTTPTAVGRTASQDVCLYRHHNAAADGVVGAEWGLWPRHIDGAVGRLVELTSLLLQPRCQGVCGGVHGSLPFSFLRGRGAVVVLLAAPVHRPRRRVLFFVAEMTLEDIPAAPELRAFAAWMLSKVL